MLKEFNSTENIYWTALRMAKGVGSKSIFKLRNTLSKSKHNINEFWVSGGRIEHNIPLSEKIFESIKNQIKEQDISSIKDEFETNNIRVIAFWDEEYPALLKEIDDPPVLLFVQSKNKKINWHDFSNLVGVVGSRNNTSYGRLATLKIVRELVVAGYGCVSGCMYGIDSLAHQTALDAGGSTVGVLGFGHNYWYPQSLIKLKDKILENGGLLVSEHPPDTRPKPGYFAMRNRIISGLSKAVVVVEAAEKSGSLITAECAVDQGRSVFAVPGPITSQFSNGTKWLINQGATLINSGFEVAAEIKSGFSSLSDISPSSKTLKNGDNISDQIISLLEYQSLDASEIYQQLSETRSSVDSNQPQVSHQKMIQTLTDLELSGTIMRNGLLYELSDC